ncbi:MAG: V-type ATP synthase subunit E family protein [Ignisphaera sp.]|nr:V-type ATP synthase subunit E family protein [Ignisphaera sp.]MCX8168246.1 V-type ATP synthase subunit E family protein [Ignisphaera sp.]MDW8084886.1 V-type ATP synthase subunit E family protein [Ignisphaera sp.]
MESIELLRKTILEKALREAENRMNRAEEEARRITEEAEKIKRSRIEDEKRKILEELNYDARIAEAKLKARLVIHDVKHQIVRELEKNIINFLKNLSVEARLQSLLRLLDEALQNIFHSYGAIYQVVIKVSEHDIYFSNQLKEYARIKYGIEVINVETAKIIGGLILESTDGAASIDNSYDSRILTVLKNMLPSLVKEIFQ